MLRNDIHRCEILCAIGSQGTLPQTEIGSRLGLEKSWVSRAVDRLEKEGYVKRSKCCEDARVFDVSLTTEGKKKYEALDDALNSHAEDIMSRLPESEREGVRKALALLADAISGVPDECRCGSGPAGKGRERPKSAGEARIFVIRQAAPSEKDAIAALLRARRLPSAGFEEHLGNFIVAEQDGAIRACAGFEQHNPYALVRSTAVAEKAAGGGLGTALANELERRMSAFGIPSAFLLTDTAGGFWENLGYRTVPRETAPEALRSSEEFKGACPESAVLMVKNLERPL